MKKKCNGCGLCADACQNVAPKESCLTNFPVQIKLLPPNAPYLDGADLLIAADCAPPIPTAISTTR